MKFKLLFIILVTISGNLFAADSLTCVIKGSCLDFKSEEVSIACSTVDTRYHCVRVPIVDGKFEYTIKAPYSEAYDLVIKNIDTRQWHNAKIFLENGTVELLFSEAKKPIVDIKSGAINALYNQYLADYRTAQTTGFMVNGKRSSLVLWKCDYVNRHPNEVSYYVLIHELRYNREQYTDQEVQELVATYQNIAKKMPHHIYTSQGAELVKGLSNIKVGGRYIDFVAPDLNGNPVKVSDVIKGKVAIIDLWASWCSPCRSKSMKLKPIYEEYKSKGFEVIGVAREFKNCDRLNAALKQDGYVWTNLVEMDDRLGIWNRYLIGNSGGCVFMVDKDGTILFINPTPEQVVAKLKELL